jgi:hypothetical protein
MGIEYEDQYHHRSCTAPALLLQSQHAQASPISSALVSRGLGSWATKALEFILALLDLVDPEDDLVLLW